MAFNIYKWRRDQLLTESSIHPNPKDLTTNPEADLKKYREQLFQQLLKDFENDPEAIKIIKSKMNVNENIDSIIDEFKSKFPGVSISPEKISPDKLECDIKAKFDFKWGDWEGQKEQEEAITKFFESKGYKLVDSFEIDDPDRRPMLSLYYKKI